MDAQVRGSFCKEKAREEQEQTRDSVGRDQGEERNDKMAYVSICLDLARREIISTQSMSSITLVNTANIIREALKIVQVRVVPRGAFDWVNV